MRHIQVSPRHTGAVFMLLVCASVFLPSGALAQDSWWVASLTVSRGSDVVPDFKLNHLEFPLKLSAGILSAAALDPNRVGFTASGTLIEPSPSAWNLSFTLSGSIGVRFTTTFAFNLTQGGTATGTTVNSANVEVPCPWVPAPAPCNWIMMYEVTYALTLRPLGNSLLVRTGGAARGTVRACNFDPAA